MESALLYSAGKQKALSGVISVFTQNSVVIKEGLTRADYDFVETATPIKSYRHYKQRKRRIVDASSDGTRSKLKSYNSKRSAQAAGETGEVESKEHYTKNSQKWQFQNSAYNASKITHIREPLVESKRSDFSQPYVLDSFTARRDIIPNSTLSSSTYCCDNLLPMQTYKGMPSAFLNKERLTRLSEILLKPSTPTRLLNVDANTTRRLKHFSNFICPCGFVCGVADKSEHQKVCAIHKTSAHHRINHYRSLSPKNCPDIDLPVTSYRDAQQSNEIVNRATYWGIETGYKFGKVIEYSAKSARSGYHLRKVYKCPLCDFWCTEVRLFSNHVAIHEPQKPFGCSACDYRSVWSSCIMRHIKLGKLRDVVHKNAVVLSRNALTQRVYRRCRIFIKLPK